MKNWQLIYSTGDLFRGELVKNILEAHHIPAIVINKKDSSYNDFGEIEVYVGKIDVVKALNVLENEIDFK